MYYAPLPFPVFVICIVSFLGYLYKTRSKSGSAPGPRLHFDPTRINEVIDAHSDCTAIMVDSYILAPATLKSYRLTPGDRVEIGLDDNGKPALFYKGKRVSALTRYHELFPTKLQALLESGIHYDAYMLARYNPRYSSDSDRIDIVVFFKDGETPPTPIPHITADVLLSTSWDFK